MSEVTLGPLNLSDGEEFTPLPIGTYNAEVFKFTPGAVKNADGTGALPAGTPNISVQFKVTDEPYVNRRLFQTYFFPGPDYDQEKAKNMKGAFITLLKALGIPEEEIRSKKGYTPDYDSLLGTPVVVSVGQRPYNGEMQNTVRSVRPAGSATSSDSGLL